MKIRLLLLSILAALALAGCGNKGPLVQAPPDPSEEAPADDGTPPAHDESEPTDTDDTDTDAAPESDTAPPADNPVIEPVPPAAGTDGA